MRRALVLLGCVVLAGCSAGQRDGGASGDVQVTSAGAAPGAAAPAATAPQIAYQYHYQFRLAAADIAAAQARHVALCDALGPAHCRLLASTTASAGNDSSLRLAVDARLARRLGETMAQQVAAAGGRASDSSIEAEDVSRAIVDTGARLRQRELLVARLTEILRTNQGSIADLVAAERSVADAQQELDQARSELAELQGRVATSTIEASYQSADGPVSGPIGDTIASSFHAFGNGVGLLLRVFIYLLPWLLSAALLLGVLLWIIRHLVRRGRSRAPLAGAAVPPPPGMAPPG